MVILILVILGLCMGSFVNATVWRLHEQSTKRKVGKGKVSSSSDELSILKGHSMCPNCRHRLAAADLVPVLSWLWLHGKCRNCRAAISMQYPIVELIVAILFVGSYLWWPTTLESSRNLLVFVFWLTFLVGLVALAVYDLKWYLLPDRLVYPLMILAVVQALLLVFLWGGGAAQIRQTGLSFVVGGGLFYLLFQLSGGRWIGGGDVKLGMLLGLILASPVLALFTIFGSSLLGSLASLPLIINGRARRDTRIPYGPFLIAGAIVAQLFGAGLINWYKRQLGL